ncbi:hypothetical protein, partial [Wenyingzhuangia sp.]
MKKIIMGISIFAALITMLSFSINIEKDHMDKSLSAKERTEVLLAKMTLEEKIGQMNQYNGFWNV